MSFSSTSDATQQTLPYSPALALTNLSQDPNARPATQVATFDPSVGATIVNNNVAISVPPGAAGDGVSGTLTVTLAPPSLARDAAQPGLAVRDLKASSLPVPEGPAQFQPNGTVFLVAVANQQGAAVRAFAAPITIALKYSSVDLAGAKGDPALLAVGYLVDESTPAPANPDSLPVGSWIFFPPSLVQLDAEQGVITVQAQALGSAIAVFSNPAPDVQTVGPNARLMSGVDEATAQVFGVRPEGTRLRVVEPEVDGRMLVLDPATNGYAFVDAADVAPAT